MSIYTNAYTNTTHKPAIHSNGGSAARFRFIKRIVMFLLPALVVASLSGAAQAQIASMDQAKGEMSMGRADAPVTLYEYSSLTCPHCARFHSDVLPQIKKEYVDTGKVRIVFVDFPLDGLATGAVMIARCSGPKRFVDFFGMLYKTQKDWRDSDNPLGSLVALARFYGLAGKDVTACLNNQDLLKYVQSQRDNASSQYNIQSTPTFVINGKKIEGAQPFDVFKTAFDKALASDKN